MHMADDLLGFLSDLTDRIRRDSTDPSLSAELSSHLNTLRSNGASIISGIIGGDHYEEFDNKGTALWNLTTRIGRERAHSPPGQAITTVANTEERQLALLRIFSLQLLHYAHQSGQSYSGTAESAFRNNIRLFKVANKAAKFCLHQGQIALCLSALEIAADYEDILHKQAEQLDGDYKALHSRQRLEYFGLRMTFAWKQDRMDLAEVMYARAVASGQMLGTVAAESLADLLFEIGKERLQKREASMAVIWLDRSYDVLASVQHDSLNADAVELRLSIMHYLARALLALQTEEGRDRAKDFIGLLENEYGNKLVVLLLRLELVSTEQVFDADHYYNVLNQMIRTMHLTNINLKTILHHVHILNKHNTGTACQTLDDLLLLRLYGSEKQEWMEKAFILRLWMATALQDSVHGLESLSETMTGLNARMAGPLNAAAAHAAQTLIWKRVDNDYNQNCYVSAEAWCQLALHHVFAAAGDLNKQKIMRKMILCSTQRQDTTTARQIYNQMTEVARKTPMTRYLMYKIALRDHNTELAAECIDSIAQMESNDVTLLYACVLEAQQSGDKQQAISALQKVATRYNYNAPDTVHLPALLRYIAKLLISELQAKGNTHSDTAAQICGLFKTAAMQAGKKVRQQNNHDQALFDAPELEWFAKNSYNTILKYYGDWDASLIIDLLHSCIGFLELWEDGARAEQSRASRPRLDTCNTLAAKVLVRLARAEDTTEIRLQHYLGVRKHCQAVFRQPPIESETGVQGSTAQMRRGLLINDFEAAIHLGAWDDLIEIITTSLELQNHEIIEVLADMTLASEAPPVVILNVIEHIVTSMTAQMNTSTLARWFRILYQLSLTKNEVAKIEIIIQHVCALNNQNNHHAESGRSEYPPEELEWLATTTFNRAIDAYCVSDEGGCRRLAEQAMCLAGLMSDGGALRGELMGRYSKLRWERINELN